MYTSVRKHSTDNKDSRGGGQVVRVLAFHSDDLSLNPAEVYNFPVFEKSENKQKEVYWPIFK